LTAGLLPCFLGHAHPTTARHRLSPAPHAHHITLQYTSFSSRGRCTLQACALAPPPPLWIPHLRVTALPTASAARYFTRTTTAACCARPRTVVVRGGTRRRIPTCPWLQNILEHSGNDHFPRPQPCCSGYRRFPGCFCSSCCCCFLPRLQLRSLPTRAPGSACVRRRLATRCRASAQILMCAYSRSYRRVGHLNSLLPRPPLPPSPPDIDYGRLP